MPLSPTRVVLTGTLVLAGAYALRIADTGAIRDRLFERFVAGVPWGTLVTVAIVVGFYLFAQSGLSHPRDPVVYPFVSWSYWYPTGILTAGIAHGGANHVVSNVTGTLVLAPIAEYVWSHYPRPAGAAADRATGSEPSGGAARRIVTDGGAARRSAAAGGRDGLLARPFVRAVVVFPAVLFAIAFLTAAFSLGPGLGFSGALYAIVGFAVVARPLATVVGVVVSSAVGILFSAFTQPVIRESIAAGPPTPPGWAGVGFQAHLLGFLLGALLAIGLCAVRKERPSAGGVFAATLVVGLVQSLWLVTGGGGEEFVQYRGAGVAFLLALVVVVATAVVRPSPTAESSSPPTGIAERAAGRIRGLTVGRIRGPTVGRLGERRAATAWLFVVAVGASLGAVALVAVGEPPFVGVGGALLVGLLAALPAVPGVLPARWHDGTLSRRDGAVLVLVAITLLVSLPTVVFGVLVVDDPTIQGSDGVDVRDYTVAYVADEPSPQTPAVDLGADGLLTGTTDGVVVTSDDRELWTVAERPAVLAHDGEATVVVGGVGWRETVAVDRVAWDVVGGDEAYAVDMEHDGSEVRSYVGDPSTAAGSIDDHRFAVVPTPDGFVVEARQDGETVATAPVPEPGAVAELDAFRLTTEERPDATNTADATVGDGVETASDGVAPDAASESGTDDARRLLIEGDDTELLLAERDG